MKSKKRPIKKIEPYLWVMPTFILFTLFTFMPFIHTIGKSFFIVDALGNLGQYVGMENYIYILHDKRFLQAVLNTFVFMLMTVPISKALGMALALLANKKRATSVFYEASFAVPMAMASSVMAMIFQLLYVPSLGFINQSFHLNVQWLNDSNLALFSLAIIQIWLSTGYAFIFMLSAVRSVPEDVLENAKLEGATHIQQLLHIYLPLTSPTMFYLVITDLAYTMMMMSLSNILTDGGPSGKTLTIMQYIYKQMAAVGNYTNANAAAVIAFVMTFVLTTLGFLWEKRGYVVYD